MKIFILFAVLCLAKGSPTHREPPHGHLRGLAQSENSDKENSDKSKSGRGCNMSFQAKPPPCPNPRDAIVFSSRECAWQCRTLPQSRPSSEAQTTPDGSLNIGDVDVNVNGRPAYPPVPPAQPADPPVPQGQPPADPPASELNVVQNPGQSPGPGEEDPRVFATNMRDVVVVVNYRKPTVNGKDTQEVSWDLFELAPGCGYPGCLVDGKGPESVADSIQGDVATEITRKLKRGEYMIVMSNSKVRGSGPIKVIDMTEYKVDPATGEVLIPGYVVFEHNGHFGALLTGRAGQFVL